MHESILQSRPLKWSTACYGFSKARVIPKNSPKSSLILACVGLNGSYSRRLAKFTLLRLSVLYVRWQTPILPSKNRPLSLLLEHPPVLRLAAHFLRARTHRMLPLGCAPLWLEVRPPCLPAPSLSAGEEGFEALKSAGYYLFGRRPPLCCWAFLRTVCCAAHVRRGFPHRCKKLAPPGTKDLSVRCWMYVPRRLKTDRD